jgi:hypothetical protein
MREQSTMNAGTFSSHDNIDCGRPTIQCFARTLAAERIKKVNHETAP